MRSAYFIRSSFGSCRFYDERAGGKSTASPQPLQEAERTVLVEHVVEVAALGALHARRAPVVARTASNQGGGVAGPAFELLETALGDPDAAGMAVVDEDGRPPGLRMDVRREAADVPAVAHRPERQQRDQC